LGIRQPNDLNTPGTMKRGNARRKPKRKMGRPTLGAAARRRIVTLTLANADCTAVRVARGDPPRSRTGSAITGLAPLGHGGPGQEVTSGRLDVG
jgi:hypothetical protein